MAYSFSPYASPLIAVAKKTEGVQLCGDFRRVNSKIQYHAEPKADQREIFSRLARAKIFSKFDLKKGFFQLPLQKDSRMVTAITTSIGLRQFTLVPFGLSISPAAFNQQIRKIISDIRGLEIFMDDLLVHSETFQEHYKILEKVFKRLSEYSVTLKTSKSELGNTEVGFLEHSIERGVQSPLRDKLNKIQKAKTPTTKKQVRSFLVLVNYYGEFIPRVQELASPLHELTTAESPNHVAWTDVHQKAFECLKEAIGSYPILRLPDLELDFILRTDASKEGIGAVLLQNFEIGEFPVAFWNQKLKGAEKNYATVEAELLAIIEAIRKFHAYLYESAFTVDTDNRPLTFLRTQKNNTKCN